MDFCKLVNVILNEQEGLVNPAGIVSSSAVVPSPPNITSPTASTDPASQTPSSDQQPSVTDSPANADDEQAKNVKQFLTAADRKNTLKQTYDTVFAHLGVSVFPEAEFDEIIYTVSKNSVRSTKDPNQIPNFQYAFPLIDLAAMVKQAYIEPTGANKKDETSARVARATEAYDKFVERLTTAKLQYPLDYQAIDPWANSVKEAYFKQAAKLDLGKLKLEAYKTVSLETALRELLKQKGSAGLLKLKPETFQPSTAKMPGFIRNIILAPSEYTSGKIPYPDIKMSAIYGSDTPAKILGIAVAAKSLFDQQFREKVIGKKIFNPEIQIKPNLISEQTNSFEETFNSLSQELYCEKYLLSQQTYDTQKNYSYNEKDPSGGYFEIIDPQTSEPVFSAYGPLCVIKALIYLDRSEVTKQIFSGLTPKQVEEIFNYDKNKFSPSFQQTSKELKPNTESTEMSELYEKFITNTLDWNKDALITPSNSTNEKKYLSDEAFTNYRDKAEKLYLQNDSSRSEMIKALVDRFRKNKYIETAPQTKDNQDGKASVRNASNETFIEGKYTIENIQKYKDKNEEAKRLYALLEEFANFIRGQFDWEKAAKGVEQLASAIGGPTVGGKR